MKLSELHFDLPKELIAQHALKPADLAKLMILNKKKSEISSDFFYNLSNYLKKGDVLVFNNSKVIPARLIGKKETGGRIEVLLLKQKKSTHWECLVRGGSSALGKKIIFSKKLSGFIEQKNSDTFIVHFNLSGPAFFNEIKKVGKIPTPPYITSLVKNSEYQTVFAKKLGSAAAPTAGLHFTKRLLSKLKKVGIQLEFVTLHVGLGTFQPVKTKHVEDHPIHSEYFEVDAKTIKRIRDAKKSKRRIIAVGTTSCRVLETIFNKTEIKNEKQFGETNIFIYPGYKFKAIDGLITNFHTPYSSLLALVYAFGGKNLLRNAYAKAIKEEWRFFSLGDGMFIS